MAKTPAQIMMNFHTLNEVIFYFCLFYSVFEGFNLITDMRYETQAQMMICFIEICLCVIFFKSL